MGKVLDFLFGKDPDIFNKAGKVQHKLPRSRWEAWEGRFKSNPNYNWRLHIGTYSGGNPNSSQTKK